MVRPMNRPAILALALVAALVPSLAGAEGSSLPDKRETFGGVVAPATLPRASSALYGFVGLPDLGAGYRQGLSDFEIEARAKFNYLQLALALEVLGKYALVRQGELDVAPFLGVGFVGDTGSRYFDTSNFAYLGIRALGGLAATYRLGDTLRLVGQLDVPYDFVLGSEGGLRFTPVAGGGAEIYLGEDISGLLLGQLGVDTMKEPSGVPVTRLGYAVRLGLGFRLF
jgi:hypothetical protein